MPERQRAGTVRPDPFVADRYNPPDDCGRLQDMIRKYPLVRDQWDVAIRE